jgi:hypothetical protein
MMMALMSEFFVFCQFEMQNVPYVEHCFVQRHRRQW